MILKLIFYWKPSEKMFNYTDHLFQTENVSRTFERIQVIYDNKLFTVGDISTYGSYQNYSHANMQSE